jgi:hypothetical protein
MKPVRAEAEASAELEEAAVWYEGKREGLGLEFLEAVDFALDFVCRFMKLDHLYRSFQRTCRFEEYPSVASLFMWSI